MKSVLLRRVAIFGAGAVGLALAFVIVALFFVTTRAGQLIDQRAFNGATFGQRSVAPVTLGLLDALPIAGVAIALIAATMVAIIRRNVWVLVVAVSAGVLANVLTQVVKHILFARPNLGVSGYAYNSLPSGHTALAAASVMVIFLVSSQRSRPVVAASGAFFIAAVGVATLANQWHRPSDVIAALLIVAFFGCLAGLVLLRSRFTEEKPARDLWSRALLWLALPCAGVVVATQLMPILAPFAYLGAAAAIAGVVLLLAAGGNHAFRVIR